MVFYGGEGEDTTSGAAAVIGDEEPGERLWTRMWREVHLTWEVLVDITRRPKPYPVLYVRCDSCGKVAPRTIVRHHGVWSSDGTGYTTPAEHECPLCGAYSPRVLGDQLDPGDSDVTTVRMTCTVRFGCFQFWRRCDTTFTVPAAATLVHCAACGERYPGPAA